MLTDVHLVRKSSNEKIGPIATSYRPMTTCARDCRFLPENEGGCYATGRINGMAKKFSRSYTRAEAVDTIKGATLFRDRVVGDLVNDGEIDYNYINEIAAVCDEANVPLFSYTHSWPVIERDRIPANYMLNASVESVQDAADAISQGWDVCITSDDIKEGTIINGRRVVTCPAQTRENVTCASCKLCSKPRKSIVRFLTHGIAKNKARKAIENASNR